MIANKFTQTFKAELIKYREILLKMTFDSENIYQDDSNMNYIAFYYKFDKYSENKELLELISLKVIKSQNFNSDNNMYGFELSIWDCINSKKSYRFDINFTSLEVFTKLMNTLNYFIK
jgi:hypothetical protein